MSVIKLKINVPDTIDSHTAVILKDMWNIQEILVS